jgi:hypothetical protein
MKNGSERKQKQIRKLKEDEQRSDCRVGASRRRPIGAASPGKALLDFGFASNPTDCGNQASQGRSVS